MDPSANPSVPQVPSSAEQYVRAYRPKSVSDWAQIAPAAIALVLRGAPTKDRARKDIQAIAAAAGHLERIGRPLTVDELVADHTLLSLDQAMAREGLDSGTRENVRGILRRLQAGHHGVPGRRPRRAPGERVLYMPEPGIVDDLARIAQAASTGDRDGSAFLAAVERARRARTARGSSPSHEGDEWIRARSFARRHGLNLTTRSLAAAVTHEVLASDAPLATLIETCGLTVRDLDLGLTHAHALGEFVSS
ncbi:hypothetical protein [Cellulomonas terrae]|uniref:Uncharacterized protein n=1 Tax=Cellulomonas terrae TaxID=311234 RepID=A0A511JP40_9CELL|nr:hypothetical protein [Cellulomonas terrae]GEL99768.1 hypothetical protein CTE05_33150 [Cellulomonas terrae]